MDKSIKVWDAEALRLLKVIDRSRHAGHGTSVNKVLWSNYRDQLLSASDDRTISVWNINFEKQPQ
jgi:WD40 repeat protein